MLTQDNNLYSSYGLAVLLGLGVRIKGCFHQDNVGFPGPQRLGCSARMQI